MSAMTAMINLIPAPMMLGVSVAPNYFQSC
jgi:hypothetical protein